MDAYHWVLVIFSVLLMGYIAYLKRFRDKGHRCFAVPDERAAIVVGTILRDLGGLKERFTFDAGPTHQMVFNDGIVLIWHDDIIREQGLPPNAISLVVKNPDLSARRAALKLTNYGYVTGFRDDVLPEVKRKFALLSSVSFDGWVLAFRRHFLKMGIPPNKRKLLS